MAGRRVFSVRFRRDDLPDSMDQSNRPIAIADCFFCAGYDLGVLYEGFEKFVPFFGRAACTIEHLLKFVGE